jgi:ribonuclease III
MSAHNLLTLQECFAQTNVGKLKRTYPDIEARVKKLCKAQKHTYTNEVLPVIALTHCSSFVYWPHDREDIFSNEKLEFLGDAFLGYFVATEAVRRYKHMQEGELSRLRAWIVGTENLASKARTLCLGDLLLLGKSEFNIETSRGNNILADAFEAVTAALLIDGGQEKVSQWLLGLFEQDFKVAHTTLSKTDVKNRLQHWVQTLIGVPPLYKVIGTESTPKETLFIMGCFVGGVELGRALALNKREATKKLAEKVLEKIDKGEITEEMIKNGFKVNLK